jgi:hypothetical protein
MFRCINADADLIAGHLQDLEFDIVANKEFFTYVPREYQHLFHLRIEFLAAP